MAVMRINKTSDYTVMSNAHFKEKNMSLQAKGLLSLMLSLPDTWDYSISGLCAICSEGETAIKNTLDELKMFGYLIVTKKMPNETGSGRIEYEYDIYEKSQPRKQGVEKQGIEKLPLVFQGVEIQGVEKQGLENHGQLNTNDSITKELNTNNSITDDTPAASPPKKSKKPPLSAAQEERFNRFWKSYPRKVSKGQAIKAWVKINPDEEMTEQIIMAVETAKKRDDRFREEKYTPHPATWLNGIEWENQYGQEANNDGGFHRSEGFRESLPEYYK